MPAWASTMAAASPFGPAPITQALPFIGERSAFLCTHHCRGETVGHSVTLILPSASRCKVGAYNPTNCRRHHIPVCCFSAMVVNQYCQSTARTWLVADAEKDLLQRERAHRRRFPAIAPQYWARLDIHATSRVRRTTSSSRNAADTARRCPAACSGPGAYNEKDTRPNSADPASPETRSRSGRASSPRRVRIDLQFEMVPTQTQAQLAAADVAKASRSVARSSNKRSSKASRSPEKASLL